MTNNFAIGISAVALIVSVLTFYWTHIRVRKTLHLIRLDKVGEMEVPRFALVNSGTRDVLLTSISVCFDNLVTKSKFFRAQRVHIGEGPSMLLAAGTSVQCRVEFPEPVSGTFAKTGEKSGDADNTVYLHVLTVVVQWVDITAKQHTAHASIGKYGYDVSGKYRSFVPLDAKHDLYKSP
jgi:hypothetical protein